MNTTAQGDPAPRQYVARRRFLQALPGIGLLLVGKAEGAAVYEAKFTPLTEDDRIDIGDRGAEMVEKAYELGHDLEKTHGG